MGLETALAVASFGSTVVQAKNQSAAGKYNQAIQNRNAEIADQEAVAIEKQKEFDIARFDKNSAPDFKILVVVCDCNCAKF